MSLIITIRERGHPDAEIKIPDSIQRLLRNNQTLTDVYWGDPLTGKNKIEGFGRWIKGAFIINNIPIDLKNFSRDPLIIYPNSI